MGNEASLPMEMATNFDAEEIKRLGKRFKKLDLVRDYLNVFCDLWCLRQKSLQTGP